MDTQVAGLMVLERVAELQAQPRLAVDAACAAVTLTLQIVVRFWGVRAHHRCPDLRLESSCDGDMGWKLRSVVDS